MGSCQVAEKTVHTMQKVNDMILATSINADPRGYFGEKTDKAPNFNVKDPLPKKRGRKSSVEQDTVQTFSIEEIVNGVGGGDLIPNLIDNMQNVTLTGGQTGWSSILVLRCLNKEFHGIITPVWDEKMGSLSGLQSEYVRQRAKMQKMINIAHGYPQPRDGSTDYMTQSERERWATLLSAREVVKSNKNKAEAALRDRLNEIFGVKTAEHMMDFIGNKRSFVYYKEVATLSGTRELSFTKVKKEGGEDVTVINNSFISHILLGECQIHKCTGVKCHHSY